MITPLKLLHQPGSWVEKLCLNVISKLFGLFFPSSPLEAMCEVQYIVALFSDIIIQFGTNLGSRNSSTTGTISEAHF